MNRITQDFNFCGIYMITNLINNHRYIGSSVNVYTRLLRHRAILRSNTHFNPHLQNAWNKYQENNFIWTLLEKCTEDSRFEREKYYIDLLKPEYNIILDVISQPPHSVEQRLKQSKTRKQRMAEGTIPITNNKPVYVYYKDGSFVGKYESIRKAAKGLNLHISSIASVLKGRSTQNKGYKFFLEEQQEVKPFRKPKGGCLKSYRKYQITDLLTNTKTVVLGRKELADFVQSTVTSIIQYINKPKKYKKRYLITTAVS